MIENRKLEFFFLRYVPEQIKGAYVNIGLIMTGDGFAEVRFTRNWAQVIRLDPQADVPLLEALAKDIAVQFSQLKDPAVLLHWLKDSFSNLVQLSEVKGVVTADPEKEIEVMALLYLEPRKILMDADDVEGISPRSYIHAKMEESFESVGVLGLLLKDIPMEKYTERGNPLKLDFGYPIGEAVKFFQAASLKKSTLVAERLAYTYPKLRELMRAKQTTAFLTAVVDDDLDEEKDRMHYPLKLMRNIDIRVVKVSEMPEIARQAALELGVRK